jgi:hypothetical protein
MGGDTVGAQTSSITEPSIAKSSLASSRLMMACFCWTDMPTAGVATPFSGRRRRVRSCRLTLRRRTSQPAALTADG